MSPNVSPAVQHLGHTEPTNTYWYLHAAPELLALAADKLNIHDPEEGR